MAHRIDTEQDADKYDIERYPVKIRGEKYKVFNDKLDKRCKSIKVVKDVKEKKDYTK